MPVPHLPRFRRSAPADPPAPARSVESEPSLRSRGSESVPRSQPQVPQPQGHLLPPSSEPSISSPLRKTKSKKVAKPLKKKTSALWGSPIDEEVVRLGLVVPPSPPAHFEPSFTAAANSMGRPQGNGSAPQGLGPSRSGTISHPPISIDLPKSPFDPTQALAVRSPGVEEAVEWKRWQSNAELRRLSLPPSPSTPHSARSIGPSYYDSLPSSPPTPGAWRAYNQVPPSPGHARSASGPVRSSRHPDPDWAPEPNSRLSPSSSFGRRTPRPHAIYSPDGSYYFGRPCSPSCSPFPDPYEGDNDSAHEPIEDLCSDPSSSSKSGGSPTSWEGYGYARRGSRSSEEGTSHFTLSAMSSPSIWSTFSDPSSRTSAPSSPKMNSALGRPHTPYTPYTAFSFEFELEAPATGTQSAQTRVQESATGKSKTKEMPGEADIGSARNSLGEMGSFAQEREGQVVQLLPALTPAPRRAQAQLQAQVQVREGGLERNTTSSACSASSSLVEIESPGASTSASVSAGMSAREPDVNEPLSPVWVTSDTNVGIAQAQAQRADAGTAGVGGKDPISPAFAPVPASASAPQRLTAAALQLMMSTDGASSGFSHFQSSVQAEAQSQPQLHAHAHAHSAWHGALAFDEAEEFLVDPSSPLRPGFVYAENSATPISPFETESRQ